jgi:hypothetical protein
VELSLDAIVDLLRRGDIPAVVEQTGGGCATIQIGDLFTDAAGAERYPILCGPGWFEGPRWKNARGDTEDLYVGPDDDGVADPVSLRGVRTEAEAAATIAALLIGGEVAA